MNFSINKIILFKASNTFDAFRPYENGVNASFGPVASDIGNKTYYFKIVNGFNQTVFESNDINHKWDGKIKNTSQMAPAGKYAYVITIKDSSKIVERKTGHVTLRK